jgi:tetratricopeptide (TPR) repeat protein
MHQQVVLKACKHAFCFRCINSWQAHSTKTESFFDTAKKLSCPICRQHIEQSVVEDAIENAALYTYRASRLQEDDPERKKYLELALAEVDMVLMTDERDLDAMRCKGRILRYYAPEHAIKVYQKVLALDREGSANFAKLDAMLDQMKVAMDAGDHDEVNRLRGPVEVYHRSGTFMRQIGHGPQRLVDLMIHFAEAHEAVGNWHEAWIIYGDKFLEIQGDAHQSRRLCIGIARCLYQLGLYDRAVAVGKEALSFNRVYPGVHKLVALPQLALGQVEAARTTMRRGIVYEAPWDNGNRQENIAILEDCLRDRRTFEGGYTRLGVYFSYQFKE